MSSRAYRGLFLFATTCLILAGLGTKVSAAELVVVGSGQAPSGIPLGPPSPEKLTQNLNDTVLGSGSVACTEPGVTTDNTWLRKFDLDGDHGLTGEICVNSVTFGINSSDPSPGTEMTLELFTACLPHGLPFEYLFLIPGQTVPIAIGTVISGEPQFFNQQIEGCCTAEDEDLVVFFRSEDCFETGTCTRLWFGANQLGDTTPAYFSAPDCGIPEPVTMDSMGFPNADFVMTVYVGDSTAEDPDADLILDDGDGSGVAGDNPCMYGNTIDCDDNCPDHHNPLQQNSDGFDGNTASAANGGAAEEDAESFPPAQPISQAIDGISNDSGNGWFYGLTSPPDLKGMFAFGTGLTDVSEVQMYVSNLADFQLAYTDDPSPSLGSTWQDVNLTFCGGGIESYSLCSGGTVAGVVAGSGPYILQFGEVGATAIRLTINQTFAWMVHEFEVPIPPTGDSHGDACDNCPDVPNEDQADSDDNGIGDVCDGIVDADGDGIADDGDGSGVIGDNPCTGGATTGCDDNCVDDPNPDQADTDGDGVGDVCDGCPSDPNPEQYDDDGDGTSNECDPETLIDFVQGVGNPRTYLDLRITGTGELTAAAGITVNGTLTIESGGVLTHPTRHEPGLELTVVEILDIQASGLIDLDARGLLGAKTPANPNLGGETYDPDSGEIIHAGGNTGVGAGGSHGGRGAAGTAGDDVGAPYGKLEAPDKLGSGGAAGRITGSGSVSRFGGNGGGRATIVAGSLVVSGTIRADGGAGEDGPGDSGPRGGSGSGGTIRIEAGTLSGTGSIRANGAPGVPNEYGGSSGAGGGGRIFISYDDRDGFTGSISARGGDVEQYGAAGTI
jgi:hypothetical protein